MDPRIEHITGRSIDIPEGSHVLLCVVRNETLRLPYLLKYYRSLGFDRFLFIDNASTDGTREYLLTQPDTFVFYTEDRFGRPPGAGVHWKNAVLDRYCDGRWVMVADADEILVWPGSETETIRALTQRFDARGVKALFAVMIDMYADRPFGEIGYTSGEPFIDYAPYFNSGPYTAQRLESFPYITILGGVRARLFVANEGLDVVLPTMSKVPLVKWHAGQKFIAAQHVLADPLPLAGMSAALLHFKMLDDLPQKCAVESERGEYYGKGHDFRLMDAALKKAPGKSFFDPAISLRYENTDQLVALKLMTRWDGNTMVQKERRP